MVFGVDFGGVIVKSHRFTLSEDTHLVGSESKVVAQPGVFEALSEIVSICDGQVWIVSKASQRVQARTLAWLKEVDFFSRIGLQDDHFIFCFEREEKEQICNDLNISHFIDDRIHVMQILRKSVPQLYLFGEKVEKKQCPPWVTYVTGWAEMLYLLKASRP